MSSFPASSSTTFSRRQLRQRRASVTAVRHHLASVRIATQLQTHTRTTRIASYISHGREINTALIHRQLQKRGTKIYVPSVLPKHTMAFVPLALFNQYKSNQYGIAEPRYTAQRSIDLKKLPVWLVPLLGFDQQGNRIGMGGGYYDRSLSKVSTYKPKTIGLAYPFQQRRKIKPQHWDKPLNAVICPKQSFLRLRQK